MPIPVAVFDVDCKLLHVNMAFSKWFNLNAFALESLEQTLTIINELISFAVIHRWGSNSEVLVTKLL